MKFLERFALTIFSIIVLVLSIAVLCVLFNVISAETLLMPIYYVMEDFTAFKVVTIVLAVFIILAIKGIFFKSKKEDLAKDGIVLENGSGKLIISKESLENLVASVAKEIPGAEAVSSKTILDKDRNLKVFVVTTVSRDMMLKDVSTALQNKIKDAMKRTADLEVKEVNIKVKNISSKKVKGAKNTNSEAQEPVSTTDESKEDVEKREE